MMKSVDFEVITPSDCNHTFALPANIVQRLCRSHEGFRCPLCDTGTITFRGRSDLERLESENKRLEQERNRARSQAEKERRSKIALKGHHTRTKKRVANGVCPCCNRSFVKLHEHMKRKHPDYVHEGVTHDEDQ